jgi:hypothetical protein
MLIRRSISILFLLATLLITASAQSRWAYFGPDGKLVYARSPQGDRIADFSFAGYEGGGVRLPDVPTRRTVAPSGGDDAAAIQKAIDEVSALPLKDGFRGAVELAPGVFHCAQPLNITASGVVLRGTGMGEGGSTLQMTGDPHLAIHVAGQFDLKYTGPQTIAADAYIPSGVRTLRVADAHLLHVGDTVVIRKPVTKTWLHFMLMDTMRRDNKDENWVNTDHLDVRRHILAMQESLLLLDAPLMDNYDAKFFEGQPVEVIRVEVSGQIAHAGVEKLRIVAPKRSIPLGDPEFDGVFVENAVDSWVREVAAEETTNGIHIDKGTERVTVLQCDVQQHVPVTTPGKPFEYSTNGSQILFDRCTGSGNNTFYFATQARQQGPVVVLHCSFHGDGHIQPHQRWSPGILIDSCSVPGGGIDLRNRGEMGTGHGWTTGWSVTWNNTAATLEMNEPPGVANWSIGNRGSQSNPPMPLFGEDKHSYLDGIHLSGVITESAGKPVKPESLYLEQLAERLGTQAVKNLGY